MQYTMTYLQNLPSFLHICSNLIHLTTASYEQNSKKKNQRTNIGCTVLVCTLVCVCRNDPWHIHILGEFGVVYKAHLVKSMQQMPEVVAVKTLKG